MNRSEQGKKNKLWTFNAIRGCVLPDPLLYPISSLLKILQLITIANPTIIESIEDPPYDMIGKGAPTIGNNPNTIDIFTAT